MRDGSTEEFPITPRNKNENRKSKKTKKKEKKSV
jgi:hypothetical protein